LVKVDKVAAERRIGIDWIGQTVTKVRVDPDKMSSEGRIGPITLKFRYKSQVIELMHSSERETIEGVEVPTWIAHRRSGGDDPDVYIRVEVRDGAPVVAQLSFFSEPGQGDVREKHLRAVDVARLANDLYAVHFAEFAENPHRDDESRAMRIAEKFIERQRLPREYRVINDAHLKKVAQVYRDNIGHAPTKAVAEAFDVKDRMASTYVDRARRAGYLPPTKQGKKKA